MTTKPWDSRLALALVRPLRDTAVRPNHITTVGLAVGLTAAACYAVGTTAAIGWGAALFLAAAILDHADGELARLTGRTSAFGHTYDRAADLVVKLSLFAGMGIGLRHGRLGLLGPWMGVAAGVAIIAIFLMRTEMARRQGPAAFRQPAAGGFEIEDILYVIAPITWVGWLAPFVVAAGIGAPVFALWVGRQYWLSRGTAVAAGSQTIPR